MKKILASMAITAVSVGTFADVTPAATSIASKKQKLPVVKKTDALSKIKYNDADRYVSKKYTLVDIVKVNTPMLNVREGSSVSSDRCGQVREGDKLQVIGETNGWYKIKYNGADRYVSKEYTLVDIVKVNTSVLNVREGSSVSSGRCGQVREGDKLQVIGETNGWHKIKYNNQKPGSSNRLDYKQSSRVATTSELSEVGKNLIGRSIYRFGGGRTQSDIEKGIFDCSSFVHWAFKQVGINVGPLDSTSTEVLKNMGIKVPPKDMRKGDVIFFDTYKKDGHIGIVIDKNTFIGCQTNKGVSIENLNNDYWKKTFAGHVRRL
ncbi:hypothetical protein CN553_12795 [Bacillus cereus]|uniref:Uncharacterized protein n=1 Tax=Bacillus cereus TaxID=1396 RepID=A0A9X6UC28_BACCE|nr:SH3 domain-containing protein [Bacillus cereus]PEN97666.1 hypothetical protein CN553_12795 [Bacillus cereus]